MALHTTIGAGPPAIAGNGFDTHPIRMECDPPPHPDLLGVRHALTPFEGRAVAQHHRIAAVQLDGVADTDIGQILNRTATGAVEGKADDEPRKLLALMT
jgi:hypothetical protein